MALASIISVALLGSLGPRIPLAILLPSQRDVGDNLLRSAMSAMTSLAQPPKYSEYHAADVPPTRGQVHTDTAAAERSAADSGADVKGNRGSEHGTTAYAPMALATHLIPDLDTLKSVIATLTSGAGPDLSGEVAVEKGGNGLDKGEKDRYERRGRTAVIDSTVIPIPPDARVDDRKSALGRTRKLDSLATRPSDGVVAVAVAVSDEGYKAWARSLRARRRAQTALSPAGTVSAAHTFTGIGSSETVVNASTSDVWVALYRRLAMPGFSMMPLTLDPLSALSRYVGQPVVLGINHSQHSMVIAADWTKSVVMAALAPLMAAMAEDYARLQHLYRSLRSSFSPATNTSSSALRTPADLFSPTTNALLSLGAHIGHIADAASYRLQSLHRAIVSFEREREKQHAAAVRRVAHELSRVWGDVQEGVVLGAREEVGKVWDVARSLVEYFEYVEAVGEGAVGRVGEMGREVLGKVRKGTDRGMEGVGRMGEGVQGVVGGVKARVADASVALGRAVGAGFRYGWEGGVLEHNDDAGAGAAAGVGESRDDSATQSNSESRKGDTSDADQSARVELQKTPWWSRLTSRRAGPELRARPTRQQADRALKARSERRGAAYMRGRPWRLRAEQAADAAADVGAGTEAEVGSEGQGRLAKWRAGRKRGSGARESRNDNDRPGRRDDKDGSQVRDGQPKRRTHVQSGPPNTRRDATPKAKAKHRAQGKRRDLAPAPAAKGLGRLEPYDLARLREMWRGMKRAKRERFRRIMDQVYHVSDCGRLLGSRRGG